jgi:pimeloyl-[acyl-carrier protein] synthase
MTFGSQPDVFDPGLIDNPYPWYAEMLEAGYAEYTPPGRDVCIRVLSRHADISAVLRDPRFGRAAFRAALENGLGDGALAKVYRDWFLFQDPPDHTRLRALVSQPFTPRAVEALRSNIANLVERLLDGLQDGGDLISAFAYQVPVLVICELLGVPHADRGRFGTWSAAVAAGLDNITNPDSDVLVRGDEAADGLTDYFRDLVRERRRRPGSDLLTGLIQAEAAGDRLSEDELLATCVLLFFAGHETTVNLIGNGTLALARHPDQLARLQANPGLIVSTVEELLRFDSPVQRTGRDAREDVRVNGRQFFAGDRVILLIGAANHDPRQFPDPDRLDITRPNAAAHLSFASGIHYCVGAPLARLEAQVALNALARRAHNLQVLTDTPRWRRTFVLRGLAELPISLN